MKETRNYHWTEKYLLWKHDLQEYAELSKKSKEAREMAHMMADAVLCGVAEDVELPQIERKELVHLWSKVRKVYEFEYNEPL